MGYWHSRGLRGSALEELINISIEQYRKAGLAMIQKIPTPITPVEMDTEHHNIKKAYFEQKSTVDYIGVVNGLPLCFDAKETGKKSLPFSNIHPQQVQFMKDFVAQKGVAFFIVHFTLYNEYYLLPYEVLVRYYEGEGRKSIPYAAFEERYRIPEAEACLHFLGVTLAYHRNRKATAAAEEIS